MGRFALKMDASPQVRLAAAAKFRTVLRSLPLLLVFSLSAQVTVPPATDLGSLEKLRGQHPRIFASQAECRRIRGEITGTLAPEWTVVRKEADKIIELGRPRYQEQAQTWGREEGNRLATLAFAWLISRDNRYLDAATLWAREIAKRPVWGRDAKTGKPDEYGLVYGHLLVALAMYYDYAAREMDADTRATVRRSLRDHAASAASHLRKGTWDGSGHALQSNHTWVYSAGVMAAGLALLDEDKDAPSWIGQAVAILRASDGMLSPDGTFHEDYGYYQYGAEYLLKLVQMSEALGFAEAKSDWWKNTADYNFWMLIPRRAWTRDSVQVDFADSDRHAWYGPDHLLRWMARRNGDGRAQWLADTLSGNGVVEPAAPWLALLWKDASVAPVPPDSQATVHYFTNLGMVGARSDWSGDESLVLFKSGNPVGDHVFRTHRESIHRGEYFHHHREAAHFVLFGGGQWLIRNPGYGLRDTRVHNTLLVDGHGQLGDPRIPGPWPLDETARFPRIVSIKATPQVDRITGDAAAAYPPEAGLRSYQRELIFIKPDVLVVVDRVSAADGRRLQLNFLPESSPVRQPDGSFLCAGTSADLRIELLQPDGADISIRTMSVKTRNRRPAAPLHILSVGKQAGAWTNVTAFSWSPAGQGPCRVFLGEKDGQRVLRVGEFAVPLDADAPTAEKVSKES